MSDIKNIPASVAERLKNIAKTSGKHSIPAAPVLSRALLIPLVYIGLSGQIHLKGRAVSILANSAQGASN
ncbi:hypothetical protein [Paenibacillus rhizoplanae]|uniref:hypothetical protein n=1 Tax=Paenibacillus rhizoplanae TaxID=1917181 RepID=UPI00360F03AB